MSRKKRDFARTIEETAEEIRSRRYSGMVGYNTYMWRGETVDERTYLRLQNAATNEERRVILDDYRMATAFESAPPFEYPRVPFSETYSTITTSTAPPWRSSAPVSGGGSLTLSGLDEVLKSAYSRPVREMLATSSPLLGILGGTSMASPYMSITTVTDDEPVPSLTPAPFESLSPEEEVVW